MNWSTWVMKLLPNLIASVDPPLRQKLIAFAKEFHEAAGKTANPWNHFVAEVIAWAVGLNG